jgi:hypothetical protein
MRTVSDPPPGLDLADEGLDPGEQHRLRAAPVDPDQILRAVVRQRNDPAERRSGGVVDGQRAHQRLERPLPRREPSGGELDLGADPALGGGAIAQPFERDDVGLGIGGAEALDAKGRGRPGAGHQGQLLGAKIGRV